jgi:hypothetical protein
MEGALTPATHCINANSSDRKRGKEKSKEEAEHGEGEFRMHTYDDRASSS